MGVGGTVEGEHIVCPWHGWEWRGDGTNALIPYSKIGCKQNVKIKSYFAQEWYGFIVVWHERHGRAPYWQPPVLPELETDEYYPLHPHSRMVNRVKVHAQMIIENAADPYHVQFVHKADSAANTTSFNADGYHLDATVTANFGGGRPNTWLTPEGPVDANIIYDNYSLGLGIVRFPMELVATIEVTGQTPVDEDYTDYFYTQASVREPGDTGDAPTGRRRSSWEPPAGSHQTGLLHLGEHEVPGEAQSGAGGSPRLCRSAAMGASLLPRRQSPRRTTSVTPPRVNRIRRQRVPEARRPDGPIGPSEFGVEHFTVPAVPGSARRGVSRPVADVDRRDTGDVRADAGSVVRGGERVARHRRRPGRHRRAVHGDLPRVGVLLARRRADRSGDRSGERRQQGRVPRACAAAVARQGRHHRRRTASPSAARSSTAWRP